MRPLNIERNFDSPVGVCSRLAAGFVCLQETAVAGRAGWQTEFLAEDAEVRFRIGIVVCVDDSDGLAGALVRDLIKAVSVADLCGHERGGWRICLICTRNFMDKIMWPHES